jgi:hypothetical protein
VNSTVFRMGKNFGVTAISGLQDSRDNVTVK